MNVYTLYNNWWDLIRKHVKKYVFKVTVQSKCASNFLKEIQTILYYRFSTLKINYLNLLILFVCWHLYFCTVWMHKTCHLQIIKIDVTIFETNENFSCKFITAFVYCFVFCEYSLEIVLFRCKYEIIQKKNMVTNFLRKWIMCIN